MKIHLIKKHTLKSFAKQHPTSTVPLKDWLSKVKFAKWESPIDIKATFKTADILGKSCNRVVFDIGGNNYRMICKYAFGSSQVHLFICWMGNHTEYDKICNKGEQYTINTF